MRNIYWWFKVLTSVVSNMAAVHREAIQKQIQQDWANREYIEVITGSIKKITDFLNSFGNILQIVVCGTQMSWLPLFETDYFVKYKVIALYFTIWSFKFLSNRIVGFVKWYLKFYKYTLIVESCL